MNKITNNNLKALQKDSNDIKNLNFIYFSYDLKIDTNLNYNLKNNDINYDTKYDNILSDENKEGNKDLNSDKNITDKLFFDNKKIMKIDIAKDLLNFNDKSVSDIINEYKKIIL